MSKMKNDVEFGNDMSEKDKMVIVLALKGIEEILHGQNIGCAITVIVMLMTRLCAQRGKEVSMDTFMESVKDEMIEYNKHNYGIPDYCKERDGGIN